MPNFPDWARAEIIALKKRLAGLTTLIGDVTAGPGSGSQTATIANNAVTNTKLADMAQATIKGRAAGAGTGDPQDLTADQVSTILDSASDPFVRTSAAAAAYTNENAQDAVGTILDDGGDIDFTYDDATPKITADIKAGVVTPTEMSTAAKTETIGATFAGDSLVDEATLYVRVPYGLTPTTWTIFSDASVSVVIDLWAKSTYPPTDTESITNAAEPTVTGATNDSDDASTFDPITANDFIGFHIDSLTVGSATFITVQLFGTRA